MKRELLSTSLLASLRSQCVGAPSVEVPTELLLGMLTCVEQLDGVASVMVENQEQVPDVVFARVWEIDAALLRITGPADAPVSSDPETTYRELVGGE